MANKYKQQALKLLSAADVQVNGKRAQDIVVHNEALYKRIFAQGTLGIGESYMDGWWDARKLDMTAAQILGAPVGQTLRAKTALWYVIKSRAFNRQTGKRSYTNAQSHYDIGNELYAPMLGKTMAYSCAYWQWGAKTLDQAQIDKLDLIAKKLKLKPGMKVLDVGCGWGSLSLHLAKKYGCEVTAITPAKEQFAYAKKHAKGLKVKVQLSSWQDFKTKTKFDRIVSVGAMEHFGPKNYRALFTKLSGLLADNGLFLLHTIGGNKSVSGFDPWMEKYIFPGAVIPSVKQIAAASEGLFIMEDWHNMGINYDKTLMSWHKNFRASYPDLDHDMYDERFKRMWEYYLLTCAALFRTREMQLWQIVYSKHGVAGGYKSIR